MRVIVWKWKAHAMSYMGKDGVVGVWIPPGLMDDDSPVGRDGYVGYIESIKFDIGR